MEDKLESKLEAFLFLYGEPVKIDKLAKELGVKNEDVSRAADSLSRRLSQSDESGLGVIIFDDRIQLTTKPELKPLLAKIANEELDSPLTPASLETLSIVAYLGPCGRSLVDHIRGVNSTFILRSLMVRGLVERKPDPRRANAFLYQVSFNFLRHMGITRPERLPDYEKYRELVQSFLGGGETASEA